jgi:hypothetical protein
MSFLEKTYNRLSLQVQEFNNTWISLLKMVVRYRRSSVPPLVDCDTCYILGNGPSLKLSLIKHLDLLKQNDVVCVNHFSQSEYFELLKPKHYVLLDGLFFLYSPNGDGRDDIKATFDGLRKINWNMNIYVPIRAKKSPIVTEILNNHPFIKFFYFNQIVVSGYNWFKFFAYKNGLGMPQCQNVLGASIFVCINAGYKKIYLLGADHSWHEQISVLNDNRIVLHDKHFYDENDGKKVVLTTTSHRNANTMPSLFFSLYKAFKVYAVLNDYSESRNCKIYNASEISYIDAFERKKI